MYVLPILLLCRLSYPDLASVTESVLETWEGEDAASILASRDGKNVNGVFRERVSDPLTPPLTYLITRVTIYIYAYNTVS
jgi:hypothetical protein